MRCPVFCNTLSGMENRNRDYYVLKAADFVEESRSVDMSPLYERFLALLPPGATILDAGCGSGRDTRAFLEQGYRLVACDASPAIAAMATGYTGIPVAVQRFQELTYHRRFDGIWACASLLHVPMEELPAVLVRLFRSLKPGGILYASFKYGQGERGRDGRWFTDMDEEGLSALIGQIGLFTEVATWVTGDRRPGRSGERWLNTLLRARVVR